MKLCQKEQFILVTDNASFHVSKRLRLAIIFLPTRSPNLYLVETRINRNLKKDVGANHNHVTEVNSINAVRGYLRYIGSWSKL